MLGGFFVPFARLARSPVSGDGAPIDRGPPSAPDKCPEMLLGMGGVGSVSRRRRMPCRKSGWRMQHVARRQHGGVGREGRSLELTIDSCFWCIASGPRPAHDCETDQADVEHGATHTHLGNLDDSRRPCATSSAASRMFAAQGPAGVTPVGGSRQPPVFPWKCQRFGDSADCSRECSRPGVLGFRRSAVVK
jgi:hypothetical protein